MPFYKVMETAGAYTKNDEIDIIDPELYAIISRTVPLQPVDPVAIDIENALYGAAGIPTYPAAAAAANGVSLAEVLRYMSETQLSKLSTAAVGGLTDTHNSIAYRLGELERHFHNYPRWFGVAAAPSGTHKADPVGQAIAPFVIDGGNKVYGTWVQILGSADTTTYYDIHKFLVSATETASVVHFIQVGFGTSGAQALTDGTYSEVLYRSVASASNQAPIEIMTRRQPAGALAWARVLAYETNTSTLNFYFGLHTYEG
jgi:hypothetical protein